ncbi:MAG: CopG family transcriptional regulator [Actinomycetota bacterium]
MRRTQIYITSEQDRRIAELAIDLGVSKAEVIRQMLDRGLGSGDAEEEAKNLIRATAGLLADYPDWPEWQRRVRGRSADERLRSEGR